MRYKLIWNKKFYIFFWKMAREISPICNFILGSIHMGLLMDTVDVELTIRMVKGIYTYGKDHTAKSSVFSPWSKTVIPSPPYARRSKHSKMEIGRCLHGIKAMLHPTFLPNPNPNVDIPQGIPGLGSLTGGIDLTQ